MEIKEEEILALRTNAYETFGENYRFSILGNSLRARLLNVNEGVIQPDLNYNSPIFKVITSLNRDDTLDLKRRVEQRQNKTGLPDPEDLELMLENRVDRCSFEQSITLDGKILSVLNWIYNSESLQDFCTNKLGAKMRWRIRPRNICGLQGRQVIRSYDIHGNEVEIPVSTQIQNSYTIAEIPPVVNTALGSCFYGEIRSDFLTDPVVLLPHAKITPSTHQRIKKRIEALNELKNQTWNATLNRIRIETGGVLPINSVLNLFPGYHEAITGFLKELTTGTKDPKLKFPSRIRNYVLSRMSKEDLKYHAKG